MVKQLVLGLVVAGATAVGLGGGAVHAAPAIRGLDQPNGIKDNYIVVYKNDFLPSGVLNVAQTPENLVKNRGGTVTKQFTAALSGFSAAMPRDAAESLAANPLVAYVEQDAIATADGVQSDPPSWSLDRIDQRTLPLNDAYAYPGTASSVTAYVIDTGVQITHQDFGGRASHGYDFVDNDARADDCKGHGTHIAGTIAGKKYGVAKDAKIVAVRVLDCAGSAPYSRIIAGIDWVTRNHTGPSVANLSLGGTVSTSLTNAVQRSIDSGVVYAVSAGNDGKDACGQSPANLPDALTVGNSTRDDARYTGTSPNVPSNYGSCVDLFAPGTKIVSASNKGTSGSATMTGTSMATPHVAGVAALLYSAHPDWSASQVADALVDGATTGVLRNIGADSPNKLLHIAATNGPAQPEEPTEPDPDDEPGTDEPPVAGSCGPFIGSAAPIADMGDARSVINVTGCSGKASATAKVNVDISHENRGGLKVYIVSEDGTRYKLKGATSDTADNLRATYAVDLSDEDRNQQWKLRVYDTVGGGAAGKLNKWSLTL